MGPPYAANSIQLLKKSIPKTASVARRMARMSMLLIMRAQRTGNERRRSRKA
jgi:hypothetical protein